MTLVREWRVWTLCGSPGPMPYRGGGEQGGWLQGSASICSPGTALTTTSRNNPYQVIVLTLNFHLTVGLRSYWYLI